MIQDTHDAWVALLDGQPRTGPVAYIELWGALQAVIIQQDAIKGMYRAICSEDLPNRITKHPAWSGIRELRVRIAGHPIRTQKHKLRTVAARNFLSFKTAYLETIDSKTGEVTHEFVSLEQLIEDYYQVAVLALRLCESRLESLLYA